MIHSDDEGFYYPSEAELDRADACEQGFDRPEQAWILSNRDVWHKNPYYQGPPVSHPEDEDHRDEDEKFNQDVREEQLIRGDLDYELDDMPF